MTGLRGVGGYNHPTSLNKGMANERRRLTRYSIGKWGRSMELCEREETYERAVEYIPRPNLTFRCFNETSVANTGKLTLSVL